MAARQRFPTVIAHRGFAGAAPENTLAAFDLAVRAGADRIEFDVLLSRDGVPVVIHDAELDRTTSGHGPVAGLSLEELKRLDAGSWYAPRFEGERIPSLQEVLDRFGGRITCNIEIKSEAVASDGAPGAGEIERQVVDAVRRGRLENSVVVSSFSPTALRRVRGLSPGIARESLFDASLHAGRVPEAVCREVGSCGFNCSRDEVSESWILAAHAAGLRLSVYTVDDPEEMARLWALGVDGIFTNRPDRLIALRESCKG